MQIIETDGIIESLSLLRREIMFIVYGITQRSSWPASRKPGCKTPRQVS